jgi:hypothetical protein
MAQASLAQGVARMLEKFVEATYAREVDEVKVTTARPEGAADAVVPAEALPQEHRAVVERLLRQDVSRTAFRRVYRQRVRSFQERLLQLEPRVAEELARSPQRQFSGSAKAMQITIGTKEAAPAPLPNAATATAAEPAAPLAPRAPPLTKGILRQAVVDATHRAMVQLGVDAAQPFRPALAAQAAAHPQLRALVVAALPETIDAARQAAERKRRRPGEEQAAGREAGSGAATATAAPASPASALGRKAAPRLPASALVVKIKTTA